MNKPLLISMAFAMATTAASAQPFAEAVPFGARQFGKHLQPTVTSPMAAPARAKAQKKSNYYLRPDGALYQASDKQGQMWGSVYMYVPGGSDVMFKKVADGETATYWHQNIYNFNDECTSYDCTGRSSDAFYMDDSDNFHLRVTFDGGNSLPTLTWATDSFTIGEENPYFAIATTDNPLATLKYYPQIYAGIDQANRRTQPLAYTDDHASEVFFGGMDKNYLYGSGSFTQDGKTYKATGIYQYFDKPMAPLSVDDIFLTAVSTGYYPIAEGKELKMQIHDVLEQDGVKIPGENILYELTATEPEVIDVGSVEYDADNVYNAFNVVFTKKNSEGKAEKILLDQPFFVVVYGLDGDGITCGFEGSELPYYNNGTIDRAYGIWEDENKQPQFFSLYSDAALKVTFTGKYDYCNPVYYGDSQNYGIVKISDDGNTGETVADGENVYPGVMMKLNDDWKNEDGTENYTITGLPDWVKSVEVDSETYASYEVTLLTFKCKALPEDVKGRKCELTVHGHGCQSTYPIVLLQGDATYTGINDVKADAAKSGKIYNLAGQSVGEKTHGIVIRDGKKYLNK